MRHHTSSNLRISTSYRPSAPYKPKIMLLTYAPSKGERSKKQKDSKLRIVSGRKVVRIWGSINSRNNDFSFFVQFKKQRRVKVRSRFQPIRAALQTQTTLFFSKTQHFPFRMRFQSQKTFLGVLVFLLLSTFGRDRKEIKLSNQTLTNEMKWSHVNGYLVTSS